MESEPTIRRYRPKDGPRVRELHETAMRDADAYVEEVSDDDLERVFETYVDSGGEFLVGELDGSIVSMGAFRPVEETAFAAQVVADLPDPTIELTRMRVNPDHQRQGYGRQIAAELERRARDRGFTHVVIDTRPTQTAARGLYETMGYEAVARERIDGFDEPFDLIFYRKLLVDD